ncbi:MAG: 5'-nucleotidase C-terminal domain-containing protein [Porphyromonas sp.]|nr:5'-nucleotidase C-terminal domain-containing protein [Porphyromonas sp.]
MQNRKQNYRLKSRIGSLLLIFLLPLLTQCGSLQKNDVTLTILHTTDIHGSVFPYNFIQDEPLGGSYSRIATYVDSVRGADKNMILLDAGDILQGQPTAYYYNFIDTLSTHLMATALNYIKYDAVTVGNHDIETGHSVYDRFGKSLNMPFLAANVTDTATEKPYFQPYTVIEKSGKKIVILGLTTPSVPNFLPETLWSGMRFEDIVTTAQTYIQEIKEKQNPDMIVVLLHAGRGDKSNTEEPMLENAGYALATLVPEIDLVCCGHDHALYIDSVAHPQLQKQTYIINPAAGGSFISQTKVTFTSSGIRIVPELVSLEKTEPSEDFIRTFDNEYQAVKEFVASPVGFATLPISSRLAFFGPSAFVDLIHQVQLSHFEDADISFSSPLTMNTEVRQGEILMRDLFRLYKYENSLYLLSLSGEEIKSALEYSYDLWVRTIEPGEESFLLFKQGEEGHKMTKLKEPYYNFDSAHGIRYTVDITKPSGKRITILSLADGTPFESGKSYKVVVNSYRGSGGGGMLTKGISLTKEQLNDRILKTSGKDLRYLLMQYLQAHNPLTPAPSSTWKFVPESIAVPAAKKDSLLLFSQNS